MAKKIGVLGSGQVAKVLGKGFIDYGYEVMLGTGDVTKLEDWKASAGSKALTGTFEETAKFGDILVLALKGVAAEGVIKKLLPVLSGKTIIDTTNPLAEVPPQNGVLTYFTDLNDSLMERLQRIVPEANFVKAFNSVGNAKMVNPRFREGKPTMFICGNSDPAKKEVSEILDQFGWEIADMGKVAAARAIEPLCMLWCIPGFLNNQWTHAFKLLK
jgi:hypothetical protein